MSLKASVTAALSATRTTTPAVGSSDFKLDAAWSKVLTDGTGLNQATKVFVANPTLAGSGAVTYDLDSGSLADPSGVSSGVVAAFARIVVLAVRRVTTPASSTQDEIVALEGDFITSKLLASRDSGGADALAYVPIRPGGMFIFVAPDATGVPVTATTGDAITLTNLSSADSVELEVVIIGS